MVVRTRDRPQLLAEALDSLARGSYRRVEVVLVNDGGAAPPVPDGYPLELRRVELTENRGRAGAADAGVAAAGGDYVAFLDDDDLAAPEHLATLVGLVGRRRRAGGLHRRRGGDLRAGPRRRRRRFAGRPGSR